MERLTRRFMHLGIVSGVIGVIGLIVYPETIFALVLPFPSALNKGTVWSLLFLFILAPLFLILTCLSVIKKQRILGRLAYIIVMFVLALPVATVGTMFIRRFQPQTIIYKPKVLNRDDLCVYEECIEYVKAHSEDKNLTFHNGYRVVVGGKFYMLAGNRVELERARNTFSKQQLSEMKSLCRKLFNIGCVRFQRYDDFLIFYKAAYTSPPNGPGVIYSLGGLNPNEVDTPILNECKPFIRIAGNWYTSRHLLLKGPRSDIQCSVSPSVFEGSLRIDEKLRRLLEDYR